MFTFMVTYLHLLNIDCFTETSYVQEEHKTVGTILLTKLFVTNTYYCRRCSIVTISIPFIQNSNCLLAFTQVIKAVPTCFDISNTIVETR